MRATVGCWVVCLAALAGMTGVRVAAQAPPTTGLTYLTPIWPGLMSASPAEMAAQAALLRSRIGENATVKLGFATYLVVTIDDWPATSPAAIRAALGTFEAQLDGAIARAQSQNLALVVTLLTPIRERVDLAQITSFAEDRRVMQWYSDQTVATGWWTHSRYARRQYAVREAYMREVAKIFAARMAAHPQTLVGAAGDGEVELSNDRSGEAGGPVLADYSPFAIAEFRDWLRGAGLYAPGQPFAGEAYALAARYAGDTAPNDTSGDGISFNSDFGTAFTTWRLRYFDWSLTDGINVDANAIPAALYNAPAFSATPAGNAAGFDAPRTRDTSALWQLWARFRETMIWRHNRDLAKWMTTTVNGAGQSVPVDRWFSYQIPTDYLFNHTPDNPDARYITSASPWWTANVYPYGGMGFTSFGSNQGGGAVSRTLPGLLGAIRPCASGAPGPTCIETPGGLGSQPWGIFEWNPAVPWLTDPQVYLDEIRRLRRYRPRILAPYEWGSAVYSVLDSGFEPALRQLVTLLADGWAPSLTVNRSALAMAATRSGGSILSQTVAQPVAVGQPAGGTVDWSATANQAWVRIASGTGHGDGEFTVALVPGALAALPGGTHTATVTVAAPGSVQGTRTVTVTLSIVDAALTAPPVGNLDSPVEGARVTGAIAVTGWALDDVGVERVEIWRNCLTPIDSSRPGVCRPVSPTGGADRVFIGQAAFLPGARTDIETTPQYSGYPQAYRAGWGYLLLTNALPHQPTGATEGGQGPVTLHAYAIDREGRYTELGARTIALDNDNATRPFGSIDTPEQGGTVAATLIANFGWAMTQRGKCINTANAASYRVFIDGVSRTLTPGVNWIPGLPRADLAAAYPGLCNSGNALAAYYLNVATLGLANGLHTIGWDVYDDNGTPSIPGDDNVAGIGSRFFNVQVNAADAPASDRPARRGDADSLAAFPPAPDRIVRARVGAVESPVVAVDAGADGVRRVNMPAGSRLVMDLGGPVLGGHLIAGTELRDLPVGSTLDMELGQFYWEPPVPYFGAFNLVFVGAAPHGGLARMDVTVTIADPSAGGEPVITIGSPKPGANPNPVITLTGTAVDPRAVTGTGIAAIHVWARPLDGGKTSGAFFVGTGSMDGERYSLTTAPLLPGTYQLEVYAWVARIGTWAPAATVTIAVR